MVIVFPNLSASPSPSPPVLSEGWAGSTILHRSCKFCGEGGCCLFEGAHFRLWAFLVHFDLSSGLKHNFAAIGKFYILSRLLQLAKPICKYTVQKRQEKETQALTGSVLSASVVWRCCLE